MNQYEHIYEFAFISDKIKEIFDKYLETQTIEISFREIQKFREQLCTWEQKFPKPSRSKLVSVNSYKELLSFYLEKLDFSLFEVFDHDDQKVIQQEIAAYASREILDWQVGFRLRNWAELGISHPEWKRYQKDVEKYYQEVISDEKKELIEKYQKKIDDLGDTQEIQNAIRECTGKLFFEIDKTRLMSTRSLTSHLEDIYLKALSSVRKRRDAEVTSDLTEKVRESFDFMNLPYFADFIDLKTKYRELALNYHPDKGGSIDEMQELNNAYRKIADYLVEENWKTSKINEAGE